MTKRETVGIGMIGAGFARTTQLPGFRACAGARLVAIASGHRANAEKVAREFDIPHVAENWREIVARDDVDLISIVTPPALHKEMALAALKAGKAVLCEKPMAMDAGEAREMFEAAEQGEAFALIDHELRFLYGRQRMRDLLRDGLIGRVRHAKYFYRSDARAEASRAWNWWSEREMGGGILGALGSHAVDSLRWMLGAEVASLACSLTTHIGNRPDSTTGEMREVTTDDEANLLLRFADSELTQGATGTASMSVVEAGTPDHRMEIFGEVGALRIEDSGELWHARAGAGRWERIEEARGELAAGIQRDSGWGRGFTAFAREIVAALRAGRRTVTGAATFEDGYRTQLVLDAAHRAHESGRWVSPESA